MSHARRSRCYGGVRATSQCLLLVLLLLVVTLCGGARGAVAAPLTTMPAMTASRLTYNASTDTVPPLALLLDQSFNVSVLTRSYGAFNATLHLRASHMFPERLHGELVPHGRAQLTLPGQRALPHFARVRELVDETLGDVVHARDGGSGSGGHGHDEVLVADDSDSGDSKVPRPTLLSIDIRLQHANAPQGETKVYYIPADVHAMQHVREAMSEGTAQPAATTSFVLRQAHANVSQSWLSDVAQLVRSTSATLHCHTSSAATTTNTDAHDDNDKTTTAAAAAHAAPSLGAFALHFFSEHEFTLHIRLPRRLLTTNDDDDNDKDDHNNKHGVESVWVHAYALPGTVYDRSARLTFMQRYGVMIIALGGFVLQVAMGAYTGAQRAAPPPPSRSTQARVTTTATTAEAVRSTSDAAAADMNNSGSSSDGGDGHGAATAKKRS